MRKRVFAVEPYCHKDIINFKRGAYDAWVELGGRTASSHYLCDGLWGWAYNHELPLLSWSKREARLRFMEPISRKFDAFPDYVRYEIIPMIWDCWPCLDRRFCSWLEKHQVKTAIFTSHQNAERIQGYFSKMRILTITEGIDINKYNEGKPLADRTIDLLEFGRSNDKVLKVALPGTVHHVCTKVGGKFIYSDEELFQVLGDAKVTLAFPRCDTDPKIAGGVETLTQRYWENMLSRIVMLGRAPRELTELIGYNPVVNIDKDNPNGQILDIIAHIEDYQVLVDKNRETALQMSGWDLRMKQVMDWLKEIGYDA